VRFVVTGGCGFIGSNLVRHLLASDPEAEVVNLDLLTYAGNPENLAGIEGDPRYRFVRGDIADPAAVRQALSGGADAVINLAAESHVDRSLYEPGNFIRTNIVGTQVLLEECRRTGVGRFVQVSTDEVYGSLGPGGKFTEESPLDPSSPYSASKAGADLLVLAYGRSFGLNVSVTRCSNNYGPYQFPEKLIPLFISNALEDQPLPVYGDGLNVRDWIHVEDHCRALELAARKAPPGSVYNIGASEERTNLEIGRMLLALLGKPESLLRFVQDRPGHDRRYAIDAGRIRRDLGWSPRIPFREGLASTVRWYVERRDWWERIKSGAYRDYYQRHYGPGGLAAPAHP
jgi:dTDP-glucose 4,6-dehydratase